MPLTLPPPFDVDEGKHAVEEVVAHGTTLTS